MSLEADRIEGLPHPREVTEFYGNLHAETELYDALNNSRLHHGWIFSGPKGIGKATLAYRFARRYLGAIPSNESPLASVINDPIVEKIANNAFPDLRVATRFCPKENKIKRDVSIEAIKKMAQMFELKSNSSLGRRIAIVDCADDLNISSANALLKTLEEPPEGAILILIANSLGAILPTIRSRCRVLNLRPMENDELKKLIGTNDMAAISLSKGAYGAAIALKSQKIEEYYRLLARHLNGMPHAPLEPLLELSNKANDIEKSDIIFDLIENWLYRTAQAGLGLDIEEIEPGESASLQRLASSVNPKIFGDIDLEIRKLRNAVDNNLDKPAAIMQAINTIRLRLQSK